MQTVIPKLLSVGDWVKGKTRNGELVHGYVESLAPYNLLATVKVMDSDHAKVVGSSLKLEQRQLQKLPVTPIDTQAQVLNFIDLALSTKDQAWFHELSDQLQTIKGASRHKETISH